MRFRTALLVAVAILVVSAAPALAWGRVVVGIGPLWFPPYPYPYPYVYPSAPVVIEQSAPPVYVESQPAPPQQYWYYCEDPRGYYPYVSQCPRGWMQVLPQAPPTR